MLDLFMSYEFIVKKETCFNTGEVMSWQDTFCQIFIFISEQVCPVSGQFFDKSHKSSNSERYYKHVFLERLDLKPPTLTNTHPYNFLTP